MGSNLARHCMTAGGGPQHLTQFHSNFCQIEIVRDIVRSHLQLTVHSELSENFWGCLSQSSLTNLGQILSFVAILVHLAQMTLKLDVQ